MFSIICLCSPLMALHISITVRTIFCLLFLCPLPQSPQLAGRMINTALARLTPHQLNNKHPEHVRVTTKCATCIHYYVDDETHAYCRYFVTFCHRRRQHQVINCLWPFLFVLGGNGSYYQELC